MEHITRAGMSPQGKPKVYYTAHPDDFDIYFDMITSMILERQDCVIFYDRELENAENILDDIDAMQLIVLPVTSRFLYRSNTARDVVLKYANEKFIPVLPILMEGGIESAFNEICGEIQCLSAVSKDTTELPYEEKLTMYLDSVLIGDELAAKIRAAFDAYVFLSYRKKDRQYAQKLMKLIHENEFCRDIAIWYDEFLVPGENFNQAIKSALEKSALFALVVTPNLVNEQNYVMSTEYPMAMQENKHIFPVEMQTTDRKQLENGYPHIPECVCAEDKKVFSDILMKSVEHIARTEKNDEPQHIFFIGLAYLNGIDVEKDIEKGVRLITAAADAGLIEAMEKLKTMYRNGIGVRMDYAKAAGIQEKLVEAYKSVFDESGALMDESNWLFSMICLGECLYDSGDLVRSKETYESIVESCAHIDNAYGEKISFRIKDICYENLGKICSVNNNFSGALGYYKKIDELELKYKEQLSGSEYLKYRALSLGRLGNIYEKIGHSDDAVNSYMGALKFYTELLKYEETESNLDGLAKCYHNLAVIYGKQYKSDKALEYYEKACKVLESIVKSSKDISKLIDLTKCYANIADMYMDKYDYNKAGEYISKALETIGEPADKYGTLELQRTLSYVAEKNGILYHRQGKYEASQPLFKWNCNICENILKDSRIPEDHANLAGAQLWYGLSLSAAGDLKEAYEWCGKALYTAEHIPGVGAADVYDRLLSKCNYNVGIVLYDQKLYDRAPEYFQKASEYIEPLCRKYGDPDDICQLTKVNEMIASVYRMQGNYPEAKNYIMSSIKMSEEQLSATYSLVIIDDMAGQYAKYADLCRCSDEYEEAAVHYNKAIAYYEVLLKFIDKLYYNEQLINIGTLLASCYEKLGRLNDSLSCYEKSAEIMKKVLKKYPQHKNRGLLDFFGCRIAELSDRINGRE